MSRRYEHTHAQLLGWGRWLAALLFSLALLELTVRLLLSVPEVRRPLVHGVGPRSSELGWLYAPAEENPHLRWDAQRGWVNQPGARQEWGWTVTVAPSGAREPAPAREREPGALRVAVLGDSFAFGSDMGDAQVFPALLAATPGLDVVNLGVPGYDYGQMLLHYELEAGAWRPTHVLIGMVDVLIERSLADFFVYVRPMIPAERGLFEPENTPVPAPDVLRARWTARSHAWTLLQAARWSAQHNTRAHRVQQEARSEALLRHLVDAVRAEGQTPWLVALPMAHEAALSEAQAAELAQTRAERRWMEALCTDPAVWCTDGIDARFRAAHQQGATIAHAAHWSELGHRLVADALTETLSERRGPPGEAPPAP